MSASRLLALGFATVACWLTAGTACARAGCGDHLENGVNLLLAKNLGDHRPDAKPCRGPYCGKRHAPPVAPNAPVLVRVTPTQDLLAVAPERSETASAHRFAALEFGLPLDPHLSALLRPPRV